MHTHQHTTQPDHVPSPTGRTHNHRCNCSDCLAWYGPKFEHEPFDQAIAIHHPGLQPEQASMTDHRTLQARGWLDTARDTRDDNVEEIDPGTRAVAEALLGIGHALLAIYARATDWDDTPFADRGLHDPNCNYRITVDSTPNDCNCGLHPMPTRPQQHGTIHPEGVDTPPCTHRHTIPNGIYEGRTATCDGTHHAGLHSGYIPGTEGQAWGGGPARYTWPPELSDYSAQQQQPHDQ